MYRTDSAVAAFFYQVRCTQTAGHCSEPAGISGAPASRLSIYPNPATDLIQITTLDQSVLSSVSLYDCTGRQILQQTGSGKSASLSLRGLSPGVYLLRLDIDDGTSVTRKVVIE